MHRLKSFPRSNLDGFDFVFSKTNEAPRLGCFVAKTLPLLDFELASALHDAGFVLGFELDGSFLALSC